MSKKSAEYFAGFNGPWFEFGDGICECGDARRLYSPVERPEIRLCAPCTQRGALASIPNHSRDEVA